MAPKKDVLPVSLAAEHDSTGTITYANEVIAIIAGVAANEVEGIAGMCSGGGFSDVFVRRRNIKKGVKVEIGAEEASVDLYVIVEYGTPIQIAAQDVQDSVRKAIETMTGLHVVRIDVHVNGVSFEKEKLEEETSLENAMLADAQVPALEENEEAAEPAAEPKTKKAKPAAKTTQNKKPAQPIEETGQDT
ncbi:MAG: Asp23/Gls24 family envelope stress response protein [Clostridiales bacterium]|nr:Asp23/Gls24 family envelope stress response protein [Clostridiales bacterium]